MNARLEILGALCHSFQVHALLRRLLRLIELINSLPIGLTGSVFNNNTKTINEVNIVFLKHELGVSLHHDLGVARELLGDSLAR